MVRRLYNTFIMPERANHSNYGKAMEYLSSYFVYNFVSRKESSSLCFSYFFVVFTSSILITVSSYTFYDPNIFLASIVLISNVSFLLLSLKSDTLEKKYLSYSIRNPQLSMAFNNLHVWKKHITTQKLLLVLQWLLLAC